MSQPLAVNLETRTANADRWARLLLLSLALLLRLAMFPHLDETRNIDETGYLKGSLAMLEGLPAGYKAAPAGPNLWMGWLYAGGVTALDFLHPGPEERRVPIQVRPFVALEHALFDQYRDLSRMHILWIVTQVLLALWTTIAAYRMGRMRGGIAGGLMLGGSVAVLPLFVDFTLMSRPYMTAWCFGLLSLASAATGRAKSRVAAAGIFLGLAVASRLEMLLFAPVVLWEFWHRREPRRLLGTCLTMLGFSLVTTLLAAPWLLTHLIGNLRTVATVRLGPNPHGPTTLAGNLLEFAWRQGLIGAMLAFAVVLMALLFPRTNWADAGGSPHRGHRLHIAVLGTYVILLLASLGHGTIFIHQQGPVVLALVTFAAFAAALANRVSPAGAVCAVVLLLLVPLWGTIRLTEQYRKAYCPDSSVAWVETHVAAGTIVYFQDSMRQLLPTPASAQAQWDQFTNDSAWRRKFAAGLERFHLRADQIPPALSEENMVQERGNMRGMFILGGRTDLPEPRFDLHRYNGSPLFDPPDVVSAFAQTGGVLIWRGEPLPDARSVAAWTAPDGTGIFIYCSPDVQERLGPNPIGP